MNRQQWALVAGSVALTALLYFGLSTKPPKQRLVEKSGADNLELQETENILRDAKAALSPDIRKYIQGLENLAEGAPEDSVKSDALKSLSAVWFQQQDFLLAGYYAERVAQIEGTAESWAVAGTTYGAVLNSDQGHDRRFGLAVSGAIRAFENAISLDPENPEHRINLALCYAEHPPADQPMKGIQLLLDLNRNYPENTSVLYHLARLGMQTRQYDKAEERLKTALAIDPDQKRLNCLMARLMRETQQPERAEEFDKKCL